MKRGKARIENGIITDGVQCMVPDMALRCAEAFISIDEWHDQPGNGPDGFEILEFIQQVLGEQTDARTYAEWQKED